MESYGAEIPEVRVSFFIFFVFCANLGMFWYKSMGKGRVDVRRDFVYLNLYPPQKNKFLSINLFPDGEHDSP